MKILTDEVVTVIAGFRQGNMGYYDALEGLIKLYNNGLINIGNLDNGINQLKRDFTLAKKMGYDISKINWEVI